jgi:hypothetical protein
MTFLGPKIRSNDSNEPRLLKQASYEATHLGHQHGHASPNARSDVSLFKRHRLDRTGCNRSDFASDLKLGILRSAPRSCSFLKL